MRELIVNILSESADVLLFGSTDYPKVNDLQIPQAIDDLYTTCADHIEYSMANFLTFGLWSYFRVTPTIRQAYKFGDQIKEAIADEYRKRCKKDVKDLGFNIIDLMAKHEKECNPDEK